MAHTYTASILITLRPSILDPQGKATQHALTSLGYEAVRNVRIGKHIVMEIEAPNRQEAGRVAKEACDKLLANPVMENFEISIEQNESSEEQR